MSQKSSSLRTALSPQDTPGLTLFSYISGPSPPSSPPLLSYIPKGPVMLSTVPGGPERMDHHLHFNPTFDVLRDAAENIAEA